MSVNKVVYGNDILIDLTGDTLVSADQLAKGVIAHTKSGEVIVGTGITPITKTYSGNGSTTVRTIDTETSSDACVITCTNGNLTALVTKTGMFYGSTSTAILFKDRDVAYFENGILHLATGQYINGAGRSYEIQVL